ncbi:hypothetical protein POMI540_2719 [Schizosaccharomyces pombe]|uniref:Uncharacterized protein PB16A4.06c n=1 Tax=Schizosaccharomyces pombe (strain 972 / ATCC 24843) TaxID=284812 RepID=YJO6_SCHPO|nr:uncharacterized protein SPCPB16A4.06c [Schizosaccharomyces pombe]Q96WU9.1 RecName: Full=Uncharacterized protein PB16A4.06c [Schizosaccharomyces pombe 972h-]CAC39325.1 sequence orphan [Schizosaccharomyces pombe]|eukprot:NP_001342996.1 uncharacterized protein SPCPB16A4.06c [Schizosaccharomyces pombe]
MQASSEPANVHFEGQNQSSEGQLSTSPPRRWRNCTLQRHGSRASADEFCEQYRSRSHGPQGRRSLEHDNQFFNSRTYYGNGGNTTDTEALQKSVGSQSADEFETLREQTVPNPIAEAWRKYFRKVH